MASIQTLKLVLGFAEGRSAIIQNVMCTVSGGDGPTLAYERLQFVQQSVEGQQQDAGPAPLLQLVLRLLQAGPELGGHGGRQAHLQGVQQPRPQVPAQATRTQHGQRLGHTLLGRTGPWVHLNTGIGLVFYITVIIMMRAGTDIRNT